MPAPPERRSLVFLVQDAPTAERLALRLAEPAVVPAPGHRPLPVRRARAGGRLQRWRDARALRRRSPSAWIVDEELWRWADLVEAEPARFQGVYVRPELLLLDGLLTAALPPGTLRAEAWVERCDLDRRLAGWPRVWAEDVHGGGTALIEALGAALAGGDAAAAAPGTHAERLAGDDAGHLASLAALTAAPASPPPVALDPGLRPVRQGCDGARLLHRGWSLEPAYAWTLGPAAFLRLPDAPGAGRQAVELEGFLLARPDHPVRVTAFAGGRAVARAQAPPGGPGEVRMGFATSAPLVQLAVEGAVAPHALDGLGDTRRLGFALRAVSVGPDPGPATTSAEAAAAEAVTGLDPLAEEALRERRPDLLLVVGGEPGRAEALAAACAPFAGEALASSAAGLDDAVGRLVAAGRGVGFALLLDAPACDAWAEACARTVDAPSGALRGADVALLAPTPEGMAPSLLRLAVEQEPVLHISDGAVVLVAGEDRA